MAEITLKGQPIHTAGDLPTVGSKAPAFKLTNSAMEDVGLEAFAGKRKLLNIVPSLDTDVCAASAARFNKEFAQLDNAVLLNISADLPTAAGRLCESNKWDHVVTLSTFRSPGFGQSYGVVIVDGPIAGFMSRAILVLDKDNVVQYAEHVPEIAQEPDYEAALTALR